MTRYQVFVNHSPGEESFAPESPELVACEIAIVLSEDALPTNYYVAHVEDTPEATMATLRSFPKFSIELDAEKIEMWTNVVQPIHEQIENLIDTIDEAYSSVAGAKYELDELIDENEIFEEIDRMGRKGIDRAFEYLEHPDKEVFIEKIEEIFSVKTYESSGI